MFFRNQVKLLHSSLSLRAFRSVRSPTSNSCWVQDKNIYSKECQPIKYTSAGVVNQLSYPTIPYHVNSLRFLIYQK